MDALLGILILVALISLVAKHPGGFLITLFIIIIIVASSDSNANFSQSTEQYFSENLTNMHNKCQYVDVK